MYTFLVMYLVIHRYIITAPSHYKAESYTPTTRSRLTDRSKLKSAPSSGSSSRLEPGYLPRPHSQPRLKRLKDMDNLDKPASPTNRKEPMRDEVEIQPIRDEVKDQSVDETIAPQPIIDEIAIDVNSPELSNRDELIDRSDDRDTKILTIDSSAVESSKSRVMSEKKAAFLQTGTDLKLPHVGRTASDNGGRKTRKATGRSIRVPPFVMLESLHAGQVFVSRPFILWSNYCIYPRTFPKLG